MDGCLPAGDAPAPTPAATEREAGASQPAERSAPRTEAPSQGEGAMDRLRQAARILANGAIRAAQAQRQRSASQEPENRPAC